MSMSAMTMTTQISPTATAEKRDRSDFSNYIRSIAARTSAWIDACADYYAAAAIYEQLSRLSDAELHRRGLTRATLARDACQAFDSSSREAPGG